MDETVETCAMFNSADFPTRPGSFRRAARTIGSSFIIVADALEAVDHRGVIAAAERAADLDELHAQQLAHEVHRDLARHGEILGARLGAKAFGRDAPFLRDGLLDGGGVERRAAPGLPVRRLELVAQRLARELDA